MLRYVISVAAVFVCMAWCGGATASNWIVISEIMYHPTDTEEVLEFVEIHNPQTPRVDLSGWRLEGEVEATFPPGTVLHPHEYLVVARSPEHLQASYGLTKTPLQYVGKLDNSGGDLELVNRHGIVKAEVSYSDDGRWPTPPDGTGHSLCLLDPFFDLQQPDSWRPSPELRGTPGSPNGFGDGPGRMQIPDAPAVVVNEARGGKESFIELFNRSGQDVNLSGWFLTDEPTELQRYMLPAGARIEAGGHLLIAAKAFKEGFQLGGKKLRVALTKPSGVEVVDLFDCGKLEGATSRSRIPDGGRRHERSAEATPGKPNVPDPRPSIVISEIMYNPISGDSRDEYVEIFNQSASATSLAGMKLRGGVRFDFPGDLSLDGHSYLVIAKDPSHLATRFTELSGKVQGPFKGTLADGGEELELRADSGKAIDIVAYDDGDPWPVWADGLGASIELIDPLSSNDLASAWRATASPDDSVWETYRYLGKHEGFGGANESKFQFMLLGEGECLIDDVKLVTLSGKVISSDGSLSGGGVGWEGLGSHGNSDVVKAETGKKKKVRNVFHLVATGRGNTRYNFVTVDVRGKLVPGKKYGLQFKAKWLRGSVQLLTRTFGHGVAHLHDLKLPDRIGTPGTGPDASTAARPVLGTPTQSPVAPAAKEPVVVRVPIESRESLKRAEILYRKDPGADVKSDKEAPWSRAPLVQSGDAWEGTIPGLSEGLVEFRIEAEDLKGGLGIFPRNKHEFSKYPPKNLIYDRAAMYLVGLETHDSIPTYSILVAERNRHVLDQRAEDKDIKIHDNRMFDATLVYGNSRLFYNAEVRWRGSPYTRSSHNWRVRFGADNLDGRGSFNLDGQLQDPTLQNEKVVHWLLAHLDAPSVRHRYVQVRFHGRETAIFEDVERINGAFLRRWFPGEGRGNLHKIDQHFEFVDGRMVQIMARLEFKGKDPEAYRWNFQPRSTGTYEDFEPFVNMVALMDPKVTKKRAFLKKVEDVLDVDEWLRTLAVRAYVCDWDTFGVVHGKNAYFYRSPGEEGRWNLLAWDSDLTFSTRMGSKLFTTNFPSVARLLSIPAYKRQYESYLAYLATGPCSVESLRPVLAETKEVCGRPSKGLLDFAEARAKTVLSQIPRGHPFSVRSKRVKGKDEPDRVRLEGSGPIQLNRVSVNGTRIATRFVDAKRWVAEMPIGPEKAVLTVQGEDMSGNVVGRSEVKVKARSKALPLDIEEPRKPEAFEAPQLPTSAKTLILDLGKGRVAPTPEGESTP